jgi:putative ABC transport system permease protein
MGLLLRLAWRNLWRHKRRTWLTASAIAFAAGLLVFMITVQLGAYDMIVDNTLRVFMGQMQIQREGYLDKPQMHNSIPQARALADKLRRDTGNSAIAVRANGFALAASATRSYGVPVVGVEPAQESLVSTIPTLIKEGRYLSAADAQEVVVGTALARNLRLKLGDELTLLGSGRDGSVAATVLPIVGIFESGTPDLDRQLVQMPLGTFQEIFSMGDHAHAVVISGSPLDEIQRTYESMKSRLPSGQGLVLLDWDRLIPGLKQLIQVDMAQNWFIYMVLIVVVTFSILNTFLMAVLERTREFGVMLALGATPVRIGALVMLESALLTFIGLAIGIGIGGAISGYYYFEGFTFPGMKEIHGQFGLPGYIIPKISFLTLTLGPAAIFFFTLLAALYPALRIRRLKPVEAIHAV